MAPPSQQQQQPADTNTPPDKIVLVLIDGVGDVTIPAFGDRTPLQVAHTPNMDCIAAAGVNGLLDAVDPGLACGSDTSHMNLLGYDPRQFYRGRGAFESMGAGLRMAPGDIAFKSNFATYNRETGIVEHRRADRHFEHIGPTLCAALDGLVLPSFPQHAVSVKYATEHRCGVVVRGPGLSDAVSGTDPLKDNLPLQQPQPLDDSAEAVHTAAVVSELSAEMMRVLESHPIAAERAAAGLNPANCVLLRGCGSRIQVPQFTELQGMRGALVAPTKIIAGLGLSFGLDSLDAHGATGSYDSHFASKAATAAAALTAGDGSGYDFVLLHVKAVDDTGHDRMLAMKVKFLEVVDRMIGHLLVRLHDAEQQQQDNQQQQQRYCICVTADHSTPVVFGDHSHEPVPFAAARVCDVVGAAMGGCKEQLDLRRQFLKPAQPPSNNGDGDGGNTAAGAASAGGGEDVGRIPLPNVKQPPPLQELLLQAQQQHHRRAAAAAAMAAAAMAAGPSCDAPTATSSSSGGGHHHGSDAGSDADLGPWPEALPQQCLWDSVCAFDELSAARGCLGRFTGAGVMPLLRQLGGWTGSG